MNCVTCNHPILEGETFCKLCGTPVSPKERVFSTVPLNPIAKPLKTSSFFWFLLLSAVPVVNLICMLIWAFSSKSNLNKRYFSRAVLIWWLILLILGAVAYFLFGYLKILS